MFRKPYSGLQNHAAVQEGVLYRCGQPTPAQLGGLIERHGLRTVISLRGNRSDVDPDAWLSDEREVCDAHDVRFVTIPFNHKNPPTRAQVTEFLELMREERHHPVLLHCRLGLQRTGLFCALYRIHLEGVTVDEALSEMDALGFGSHRRRHQRLLQSFIDFAGPDLTSAAPSSA